MQLLPDLTPWANASLGFVYDWVIQGNELRLTSAIANIGAGRLELRGGAISGSSQSVSQRIYDSNGSFTDVLAGSFIHHPEHDHIHFEEFAEFRLRAVTATGGVGEIVAAGDKVSFCLLDVERYGTSGPATPQYLSCGPVQGISAGWADVYHRGLPGQSIDITGVPSGEYWLEVVADPANRIVESNETNNVTRIRITLERPGGGGAIAPDTFEHNDTLATASILAPPELHTYSGLSIHEAFNDDYFRITASSTAVLAFDLAFRDSRGDVDLQVFDATGALVGSSDTAGDREHVIVEATAGEYYFVRVLGYDGATNPDYDLTIDPRYAAAPLSNPFSEADNTVKLAKAVRIWDALGGSDTVTGTSSRDVVRGGSGNDRLAGQGGDDDLYGGSNADRLEGGRGDDWLDGGIGVDVVVYSRAASSVTVDLSGSTATGGDGKDSLIGIENVSGSAFGDRLYGNGFANHLFGDRGEDRLEGRGGNDVLIGGAGRDTMLGGSGRDQFVFAGATDFVLAAADIVADFQRGFDEIDLSRLDASGVLSGNNTFVWRGQGPITASSAGELRYEIFNNAGTSSDYTMIYCDTDSDLASELRIRLTGLINLTAGDFEL